MNAALDENIDNAPIREQLKAQLAKTGRLDAQRSGQFA